MTPHEFITKWRNVELKERTASQSRFNDLCALLGVVGPITADKAGEWFTFEKGDFIKSIPVVAAIKRSRYVPRSAA